jgi:hypothetical protein
MYWLRIPAFIHERRWPGRQDLPWVAHPKTCVVIALVVTIFVAPGWDDVPRSVKPRPQEDWADLERAWWDDDEDFYVGDGEDIDFTPLVIFLTVLYACISIDRYYYPPPPPYLSVAAEELAVDYDRHAYDNPDESLKYVLEAEKTKVKSLKPGVIARKFATAAKARFGTRTCSAVNRAATKSYIQQLMKDTPDLRYTDAARQLELAVALSFIPTEDEIIASRIYSTQLMQDRMEELRIPADSC